MKKYRRLLQYVILSAVLVLGGYAVGMSLKEDKSKPPQTGDMAPEFKLPGLDGNAYDLKQYRGKAVVVNFWGSFCPPCVREMPVIEKQYRKWKDQPFEVLAINLSEDRMDVVNFIKPFDLTYPILLDQKRAIEKKYGLLSYPTTFFIDKQGRIADIVKGELTESALESRIIRLLAD
jgi:peroxiredoxin